MKLYHTDSQGRADHVNASYYLSHQVDNEMAFIRADNQRLAKALLPFVKLGEAMGDSRPGAILPDSVVYSFNHAELTNADLIVARAALAAHEDLGGRI
jgi:hypothetical protein